MQEGQFHLENKATLQNIALNANATLTLNSTSPIISITQTKGKMSLAGSVTNYTQSGGELHLQSGTITTLTSAGNSSVEIEQGGTLSSLTLGDSGVLNLKNKGSLKKAKNSGTLILREGGFEDLEQKNGHLQNHAKIEKLEASGGRIDNLGYISSLNAQSGDTFIKNQSDINSVSLSSGRLNFHNAGRVLGDFKIGGSSTLHLNTLQGIAERCGIAQITITQGNPTIIIENLQVQTQAGIPSTVVSFLNAQGTSPKIQIDKVIIDKVDAQTKIGQSIPLSNIVSGIAQNASSFVRDADFSEILKKAGFYGKYNPITGILDTNFDANLGALGIFSQVFIEQLSNRAVFYDAMLLELDRAALRYKVTQPRTNYDLFIRPYVSVSKVDIEKLEGDAKGQSTGIIGGGHYFLDTSLLALYGVVEKNKNHLDDDFLISITTPSFLARSIQASPAWMLIITERP